MANPSVRIECSDALAFLRALPDSSVDLIATDPPYFKVKKDAWDRAWSKPSDFIAWLGAIADEWLRVMRPNGSLYCFASPQMATRVECMLAERFDVLNRIVWQKPAFSTKAEMFRKEDLRSFFPASEAIIFAEQINADNAAKGEAGYAAKCDELRGFVFEPLRKYLDEERERADFGFGDVRAIVGCAPGSGLPSHWFTRSQWMLPTAQNYDKLRSAAKAKGVAAFRREYEDLRREYEDLRRPFFATADAPYTDVWTFPTVGRYRGKHPCEKPAVMMEHIVRVSSKPGDTVLDCFCGSGTTAAAAVKLGRSFVGCDFSEHWVSFATERARSACAGQLTLLAANE